MRAGFLGPYFETAMPESENIKPKKRRKTPLPLMLLLLLLLK